MKSFTRDGKEMEDLFGKCSFLAHLLRQILVFVDGFSTDGREVARLHVVKDTNVHSNNAGTDGMKFERAISQK